MPITEILESQYLASLEMLREAIAACPDALWNDARHQNRFWHIAYHALFYTHLYLAESLDAFQPWAKHRQNVQYLGPLPWPPHEVPEIGPPYARDEVLAYLEVCRARVPAGLASLQPDAPSGFDWIPLSKLELQLYNIRHVQHHAGQLADRLRDEAGFGVRWVGRKPQG